MLGVFLPLSKGLAPVIVEQVCDNGGMTVLYTDLQTLKCF